MVDANMNQLDEFTKARLARIVAQAGPPWEAEKVDRDADEAGCVYIGSIGLLYAVVTYLIASRDLVYGIATGLACIVTIVLLGRWAINHAGRRW